MGQQGTASGPSHSGTHILAAPCGVPTEQWPQKKSYPCRGGAVSSKCVYAIGATRQQPPQLTAATSADSVAGSVAIAADALGSVVLGSGGCEGSGEGSGVGSRAPSPRFGRLLAGRTLGCNLSIDELR